MKKLLAIGDSLVQGYGVGPYENWVYLLEDKLPDWEVTNQGLNGDLSSGTLRRLKAALAREDYDLVTLLVGSNDLLQDLPAQEVLDNYSRAQDLVKGAGAGLILVLPPKPSVLTEDPFAYIQSFVSMGKKLDMVYREVDGPALNLDGVFKEDDRLFIDGIHPSPEGHRLIFEAVFDFGKAGGHF